MSIKTIYESPTITDTILFEFLTTDSEGCPLTPYKVNRVTIYFAEREFTSQNYTSYDNTLIEPRLLVEYEAAKRAVCDDPTERNLKALADVEDQIEMTKKVTTFYYKHAVAVQTFGLQDDTGLTEDFPAWLNPDSVPPDERDKVEEDNILTQVLDDDGDPIDGKFNLVWEPLGMQEGDYFVCWTWTPYIAGDTITSHTPFFLLGDTRLTTSIPTHFTDPTKYETLMERYLPETFKRRLTQTDLTPEVLQELNNSVAQGFTFLEDLANQIVDMVDANVTREHFLPAMANLFDLQLKTADPTLWRRQIKQAMTIYKRKGTYRGLSEALGAAGISLNKFTQLWQVISPYTYQDYFDVAEQTEFTLCKNALPLDLDNLELYWRGVDDEDWTELTSDYIDFDDTTDSFIWIGDQLSIDPIILEEGDSIRIIYKIVDVPGVTEQVIEDYIRSLPLADLRDERDQCYPPKNWNVRVIEEDDPMFDLIIPIRHPLHNFLVFGMIRTEFPYSENVYNMDEYNGSTRESIDPCHIDKAFVDPCTNCLGSNYSVDLEIEGLTNDRIVEAQNIIRDFVPFQGILHSINFMGAVNEFIKPPVEEINVLIHIRGEEILLAGEGQYIFNRAVPNETAMAILKRTMLADIESKITSATGTAYNDYVAIYSPGSTTAGDDTPGTFAKFDELPINTESVGGAPLDNSNWLEIFAPHILSGDYSVTDPENYSAVIAAADPAYAEPVDQTQFTFRLSNKILEEDPINIDQADVFIFDDEAVDFAELGVKSVWDKENTEYTGDPWELTITSSGFSTYEVLNVLPDSILLIEDDGSLPTSDTTGLTWIIKDDGGTTRASGTGGSLSVRRRGRVDFRPGSVFVPMDDIRNYLEIGDYVLYSGTQYKIISFHETDAHQCYIDGYIGGDIAGVTVSVYRRLVDTVIGQFGYKGLRLETLVDHETGLPITNGTNASYLPDGSLDASESSKFKENYLILIGSDYYAIEEIDGTIVTLGGPHNDWKVAGTAVIYDIYRFINQPLSIPERSEPYVPGHDFPFIDRRGKEIIEVETETATSMLLNVHILNTAKSRPDDMIDIVRQVESITCEIEYADCTQKDMEV
jgi:hypothetical protein